MIEIEEFYNDGAGWICKRCEREQAKQTQSDEQLPRVWREGEAESKNARLAAPLAKWLDAARTALRCPRCGAMETVNKA